MAIFTFRLQKKVSCNTPIVITDNTTQNEEDLSLGLSIGILFGPIFVMVCFFIVYLLYITCASPRKNPLKCFVDHQGVENQNLITNVDD